MKKNVMSKNSKSNTINPKVKAPALAANKTSSSKKVNRLTSMAEFRSKITPKGKALSKMVIEGRR